MEGLRFIDFGDYYNRWPLEKVLNIVTKVKDYTDKNGIDDPELHEVEDLSWEKGEETNQRINVKIRYLQDTKLYEQWLMIMKGEVIDASEFHKRYHEFYPNQRR